MLMQFKSSSVWSTGATEEMKVEELFKLWDFTPTLSSHGNCTFSTPLQKTFKVFFKLLALLFFSRTSYIFS
jgi:hypothetical protein